MLWKREIFPEVKNTMLDLMGKSGIGITNLNENFSLPGFENLFSLLKIKEIYESNQYEHILVDCAPTGETLALLKLPELLAWYMEKFFPVGKKNCSYSFSYFKISIQSYTSKC